MKEGRKMMQKGRKEGGKAGYEGYAGRKEGGKEGMR
jgi:hypothetical protein